jgi:transposase
MPRVKTWEISDEFWAKAERCLPTQAEMRESGRKYKRKPGGGRKARYGARVYFAAIVYVLRSGIQWNALPREKFAGVSSSAVHWRFRQWAKAGFFAKLWDMGLAVYDEMEGIAWQWQSADGALQKAPLAKESAGPNPTDRGKKRKQKACPRRRAWRPAVACRNCGKRE